MFELKFDTDNAAFTDDCAAECARILREIADKLEAGKNGGPVMDYNGNGVGMWDLDSEP